MSQPDTIIQVTPVILCGGSGTRLWPLSRTGFPKQFLCLTGNESLFQQAAKRLAGLGQDGIQVAAPLIVSGEDHRFLASEQLREVGIPLGAALLEPTGRNTAPALTLAALAATENGQDPVLVVTPADQTIADAPAFTAAVQQAIVQAAEGNIVILGVTPDKPETGYGYIKTARHCEERSDAAIHPLNVQAFVEKPNPYEFGVKVGLAMTLKGNLIVGARSFPGNPYDGHTMHEQIEQSAILMQGLGVQPEVVYADLGYRGVDKDNPLIEIKHRGKDKRLTDEERRLLKRRQAIEPIIGHLKADHRMDRCHLKGSEGDALHAVLCAAGYNIRWLLRMIVKKGLGLLLCLVQVRGLTDLFEKMTEIFVCNRLQNSDQRWALV